MNQSEHRYSPGRVRDAILDVMSQSAQPLSVKEIEERVSQAIGPTPTSSVRSYLRLNTPELFVRETRGFYAIRKTEPHFAQNSLFETQEWLEPFLFGKAKLFHADCFEWLERQADNSFHAVVTDPPYGLHVDPIDDDDARRRPT